MPVPEVDELFSSLGYRVVTHGCVADPALADRLTPEELGVIDGAVDIRRNEFAGGRACAHASLDVLGVGRGWILARSDRSPIWPIGTVGSITHTEGYCLASASLETNSSIGLDAEVIGRVTDDVAGVTMSADERSWISASERSDVTATVVFAVKEALYKAQHPLTGSWVDFGDVEVRPTEDPAVLLAHLVGDVEPVAYLPWPIAARWMLVEPIRGVELAVAAVVV